ncbi:hypothetical protein AGMMS49579_01420 [Spirochaetia bacterium]|nr:hypothetical protein AGMMS49579_01420 [Spirochaetia bacterium]
MDTSIRKKCQNGYIKIINKLSVTYNIPKKNLLEILNQVIHDSDVISKQRNLQIIECISRNEHGNYIHEPSQLVFDPQTKMVIGKQNENGNIDDININDVSICNKYKFKYIIPENLGKILEEEEKSVEDQLEDLIKQLKM